MRTGSGRGAARRRTTEHAVAHRETGGHGGHGGHAAEATVDVARELFDDAVERAVEGAWREVGVLA